MAWSLKDGARAVRMWRAEGSKEIDRCPARRKDMCLLFKTVSISVMLSSSSMKQLSLVKL